MGYAKKRREKISMPKGVREKNIQKMQAKEHEEKEKRNKDSSYFQVKAFIQKRERES